MAQRINIGVVIVRVGLTFFIKQIRFVRIFIAVFDLIIPPIFMIYTIVSVTRVLLTIRKSYFYAYS